MVSFAPSQQGTLARPSSTELRPWAARASSLERLGVCAFALGVSERLFRTTSQPVAYEDPEYIYSGWAHRNVNNTPSTMRR
jgi:hypothetical protein